jgi:hypothetical protein
MELKADDRCPNLDTCGWSDGVANNTLQQLPPRTLINRYVLGRVLGQGGFGITYLSGDLREYRKLALKEYFPTSFATRDSDRRTVTYSSPNNREPYQYGLTRFEDEGRTLMKFRTHANIVSVVECFKANGTGYIVMEYLDGTNLRDHLKRQPGGRMPYREMAGIVTAVADALRAVHKAGLTHRDVSPDNIYLCRSGTVKLLDFGAARQAFRNQTNTQQVILKPGYTPLEQYHSTGVTGPWTDVYAFAATIYHCICGQAPPEAPERASEDTLVPPSRFCALPAEGERALLRALSVRPEGRQKTIDEFMRELKIDQDVLSNAPAHVSAPQFLEVDDPQVRKRAALRDFTRWWLVAASATFVGSCIRDGVLVVLALGGLAAAGVAFTAVLRLRKPLGEHASRAGAGDPGPLLLVSFLTMLGLLITWLTPWGGALLAINLLVGRIAVGRMGDALVGGGKPEPPPEAAELRCLIGPGDLAGNTLEVGRDPVVIGRLAGRSHIVIPSQHISGAHARVWSEAGAHCIWLEDMTSRNGTFARPSGMDKWIQVKDRQRLTLGDQFCLAGEDLALFEVTRV